MTSSPRNEQTMSVLPNTRVMRDKAMNMIPSIKAMEN
eukprot:CAMPEP_0182423476 /NCGR_PEP_ID=MMETSP1167-20130531/9502_1 /TAXON_ID=2988 /ORGANISM="Mallomonas Sp, Strain CCMP3275" /LENGTH=36 /DNA_ID= /DNA_START= /DNA_END= /DNA_ORIENTATION=